MTKKEYLLKEISRLEELRMEVYLFFRSFLIAVSLFFLVPPFLPLYVKDVLSIIFIKESVNVIFIVIITYLLIHVLFYKWIDKRVFPEVEKMGLFFGEFVFFSLVSFLLGGSLFNNVNPFSTFCSIMFCLLVVVFSVKLIFGYSKEIKNVYREV